MISKDELNVLMAREGIRCYEVAVEQKSYEKAGIALVSDDIADLIGFMKHNEICDVFFTYSFYNTDFFTIDEDTVSEIDEEIQSLIEDGIKNQNNFVETLDFTRPIEINIFCLYQSRYISISQYDLWRTSQGLLTGEERLMDLISEKKQLIDHKIEERKQKDKGLMEEFSKFVLNDADFKLCTNQRLRRDYMCSIFEREDTEKFKHLFWEDERLNYPLAVNFIEMLWRGNR